MKEVKAHKKIVTTVRRIRLSRSARKKYWPTSTKKKNVVNVHAI